ncbi:MAG: triose-phosphate isomerase [Proteobacteria bacterium]|nr:MAG: triose-phosphate isomerase [Pseudomonadota bacterium]QKK12198.1 MAG: triose-phosphate isomerase [Pseudomonadota bacterium]
MRQPLVAGNWKMNGSRESVDALLTGIKQGLNPQLSTEIVVCPPFVYLGQVAESLQGSGVQWGAQTVSEFDAGAYTGEVAPAMLRDFACRYVIVGHSERRSLYGEGDTTVAKKFAAAQQAGLRPILCVGELLEERDQGITEQVIGRQLDAVLEHSGVGALADAVVAYEPVWAIGTGKTASPQQAQDVHAFIRGRVAELDATIAAALRILYGGSVKAANAVELFGMPDIDGGLIGGAALQSEEFLAICRAAR